MGGVFLWLWDNANGVWEKAPASVASIRLTAAGLMVAGKHKLYWINCTPSGANSLWDLSDDITGLTAIVLSHWDTDRHSDVQILSPPMQFNTGIYLKTFTNMTSVTAGYV